MTGLVPADFDHIQDLLGAVRYLKSLDLPYMALGYVSPSGSGLKLWVLVDPVPGSDAEYVACWTYITKAIGDLLADYLEPPAKVDQSGKDFTRLSYTKLLPGCIVVRESTADAMDAPGDVSAFHCQREDQQTGQVRQR